jgi:hypothetical protein
MTASFPEPPDERQGPQVLLRARYGGARSVRRRTDTDRLTERRST